MTEKLSTGRLTIESRHSDYGDDAGGYRVLRFDGEWVGRITDYPLGDDLLHYVQGLERAKAALDSINGLMVSSDPKAAQAIGDVLADYYANE